MRGNRPIESILFRQYTKGESIEILKRGYDLEERFDGDASVMMVGESMADGTGGFKGARRMYSNLVREYVGGEKVNAGAVADAVLSSKDRMVSQIHRATTIPERVMLYCFARPKFVPGCRTETG